MQIKIRPNIEVPEIPQAIELDEGACLRDALLVVTPQLVDAKTGKYRDDPDIWEVTLNGISIYALPKGLETRMKEGDAIGMELILISGG
ncbi:MAG: hypothetical protein A4E63_03388 [Syntrophorhabdus sp. PtaU1.Bin050]|nr:MAG: hypothetical protein A4E63_03388 [Syntrophorhabdus sp. PtaU1.Bin050]